MTFTSGDWSTAQPVTVTGNDNDLVGEDGDYTVTVSVKDDSSDDAFDDLDDQILSGTVTDNDMASFVVDSANLPTAEGQTGYFEVSLPKGPVADVVLNVTSSGIGLDTTTPFSATELTFTGGPSGNWNTPHTIMVTARTTDTIDDDATYSITVSVDDDKSDDAFDDLEDQEFSGTVSDDDVAGFMLSTTTLGHQKFAP